MPVPRKITPLVILQEKLASAIKRERGACLLREEVVALVELLKELGYEEVINAADQPKNP
jgi:hypothetical protein